MNSRHCAVLVALALVPLRSARAQMPTPLPPGPPLIAPPVPGGLTADEAAQRAARTSHEVRARDEERQAAQASVDQVLAGYVPRLAGGARYSRLSPVDEPSFVNLVVAPGAGPGPLAAGAPLAVVPLSFPVILDQYVAQASLQIPVSDYFLRLPQLTAAVRGNARAAAWMQEAARRSVALDARLVFYSWARARLENGVAERTAAQARAHLKDAQNASASGVASKADVLRVESQLATADLMVTHARTTAGVLEHRLRTVMHDDSARPYEIGEELREMPMADPALAALLIAPGDKLLEEAMAQRPEPRALHESAEATRAQARATRAQELPRLDAVGNATYGRPNARLFPQQDRFTGSWDATAQLSWSPTDLFGTEAVRSGTLARARQIEEQRAALADALSLEIAQARQALAEAAAAMEATDRGLKAAEESYRVRRSLFVNGRATSIELTDAETELSRVQLQVIGARIDWRLAQARLLHALGRDQA